MLLNPTVLITGASAGIGRATTLVLAQANANVIATARSNEALLELSKKCAEMGQPIRTLAGDLNDHDFIRALTLFAGEVDILINNAGVLTYAPILETQPDDYLAMFNTNVFATLALTQAIARGMLARGRGHLIMVTSTGAREVFPFAGAYCASKAAVISYCEALRGELRGTGVQVITIAPGYVDTPLTSKNRYPMPFLMPAATFAEQAFKAIAAGTSYRVIPWQMGVVSRIMRLIPNALWDRILARQPRKHRGA